MPKLIFIPKEETAVDNRLTGRSPYPAPNYFSIRNAHNLAKIAGLAYESDAMKIYDAARQWEFNCCQIIKRDFNGFGIQAIIFANKTDIIISFKGGPCIEMFPTHTHRLNNHSPEKIFPAIDEMVELLWHDENQYTPDNHSLAKVGRNIFNGIDKIYEKIGGCVCACCTVDSTEPPMYESDQPASTRGIESTLVSIQLRGNPRNIWITGHSTGGSLAEYMRLKLDPSYKDVVVYTFGPLKFMNEALAQRYNANFQSTTFRIINRYDLIPFFFLRSTAVGQTYYLYNGTISWKRDEYAFSVMMGIVIFIANLIQNAVLAPATLWTIITIDGPYDHKLERYLEAMTSAMQHSTMDSDLNTETGITIGYPYEVTTCYSYRSFEDIKRELISKMRATLNMKNNIDEETKTATMEQIGNLEKKLARYSIKQLELKLLQIQRYNESNNQTVGLNS
ncbi:MAG: hypothetical protein ABSF18_05405 [Gammaproteobacteria bacterium]